MENAWEERRAIYRKESGKSSLRTGYLTIVVNAETESRIERRLRERETRKCKSQQDKCIFMYLRNTKLIKKLSWRGAGSGPFGPRMGSVLQTVAFTGGC